MPISRPRLPFPYPAFILKTAGIYQTVQTSDMAGGLSLYDITANSSPIFFFLTLSVFNHFINLYLVHRGDNQTY